MVAADRRGASAGVRGHRRWRAYHRLPVPLFLSIRTVSRAWNGAAELWPLADPSTRRGLKEVDAIVNDLAFSPDGSTLATASWDGSVRLWEVVSGRKVATFDTGTDRANTVTFSPDGKTLASAGSDKTVRRRTLRFNPDHHDHQDLPASVVNRGCEWPVVGLREGRCPCQRSGHFQRPRAVGEPT
ncbi:WD40 repeat domain-containing protein [Dactylosporangium sp. CA-092794]|uniref:WD40 repeat domain-containing protein n=1 Tax=Dactylosporangium sp. CA-092794 TaxID=3239929 RepID=UPI003D90B6FB